MKCKMTISAARQAVTKLFLNVIDKRFASELLNMLLMHEFLKRTVDKLCPQMLRISSIPHAPELRGNYHRAPYGAPGPFI